MSMDTSDPGGCCPDPDFSEIVDALDVGLDAIVQALTDLDNNIEFGLADIANEIELSGIGIQTAITNGFASVVLALRYAQSGVSQNITNEISNVSETIGIIENQIPPQTGECSNTNEGEACDSCGCDPCICESGQCVPEDSADCQYVGWCSISTRQVVVTESSESGPGGDFEQVSKGNSREAVEGSAREVCSARESQVLDQEGQEEEPQAPATPIGTYCSIDSYSDGSAQSAIASASNTLNVIGQLSEAGKAVHDFGFDGVTIGSVADFVSAGVGLLFRGPPEMAKLIGPYLAGALGCSDPNFLAATNGIISVGLADKLMGADFSEFVTPYKYVINSTCRQKHHEPAQATAAYLADQISYDQLDTYFAIAGYCPETTQITVNALQSRPQIAELIAMRHRSMITQDEFIEGTRQLGYLDNDVSLDLYAASETLPDIAAVSRMVGSGANDDDNANKYGLDTLLSQLQGGQYHAWLAGNGVSDTTIKNYWRAHWQSPGIGSLIEFYHRLRSDNSFGGSQGMENDISSALTSLGVTPYWQKHFLATLLQPLSKRDVRQAYTLGALSDQELQDSLGVIGHTDDAIDTLVTEYDYARREQATKHLAIKQWTQQQITGQVCQQQLLQTGYPQNVVTQAMLDAESDFDRSSWARSFVRNGIDSNTLIGLLTGTGVSASGAAAIATKLSYDIIDHSAVRSYIAGTQSQSTAYSQMIQSGMDPVSASNILAQAYEQAAAIQAGDCTRGVKERFVRGEINGDQAQTYLTQFGLDATRSTEMLAGFNCARSAEGTRIPAEKLCHWLSIGLIQPADFLNSALLLGYTEERAELLLADCIQANTLKAIKEANSIAKQVSAQQKAAYIAANKVQATNDRLEVQLAKARQKKATVRADRDKQMLSASEKLLAASSDTLTASISAVRDSIARGQSEYGLTLDESIQLTLLASSKYPGGLAAEFVPYMDSLFQVAATSGNDAAIEDVGNTPIVNGSTQPSSLT